METVIPDLFKAVGLIILEMALLAILMFIIKFIVDRAQTLRVEAPSPVNLGIKIDSVEPQPMRKDYGFAEVKLEDAAAGKTLWYTTPDAKENEEVRRKCGKAPMIVYNIQDDQNFACLLEKK